MKLLRKFGEQCFRAGQSVAGQCISKNYLTRFVEAEEYVSAYPPKDSYSEDLQKKIERYHAFDVTPRPPFMTPPISKLQAEKIASTIRSPEMQSLQNCVTTKNATRQDFSLQDWQLIDELSFELLQEHLKIAHELFNAGYEEQNQVVWNALNLNRKEAIVAEALAKTLAFCEGLAGKQLDIPVISRLVRYSILKTHVGENLPCYALVAEDAEAPTWLVIRGTEFTPGSALNRHGQLQEFREGGRESVLADFADPEAIGERFLRHALGEQHPFHEVVYKTLAGRKIILAGHSLGGCLANCLGVLIPIQRSYAFGAPGVSEKIAQECSAEVSEKLVNFHVQGDLVPTAGKALIGRHFVMHDSESFVEAHLNHHLNKREFVLQKVDIAAENCSAARRRLEKCRALFGVFFR